MPLCIEASCINTNSLPFNRILILNRDNIRFTSHFFCKKCKPAVLRRELVALVSLVVHSKIIGNHYSLLLNVEKVMMFRLSSLQQANLTNML